jgi:hypothetical protein
MSHSMNIINVIQLGTTSTLAVGVSDTVDIMLSLKQDARAVILGEFTCTSRDCQID